MENAARNIALGEYLIRFRRTDRCRDILHLKLPEQIEICLKDECLFAKRQIHPPLKLKQREEQQSDSTQAF